jgi:FkbM family methyltransferase
MTKSVKTKLYTYFLRFITFLWSIFILNATRNFLLFFAQKIADNRFNYIFKTKFGPMISLSFPSDNSWLKYSLERNYENFSIKFIKKFSEDFNGVFFDIGSNIGWFSVHMLSFNNKNIVHSFEPQKSIYEKLVKNIEINGYKNRSIVNQIGLSSVDNTKINIYNMPNDPHGHAFLEHRQGAEIIDSIQLKTLDNYVHSNFINNIKLIKIDVEGHELEVLLGAKKVIKSQEPIILFEAKINGKICDSFKEICKLIKAIDENYELYKIPEFRGKILKVNSLDINSNIEEELKNYTNLLFIPNKYIYSLDRLIN